MQYRLKIERDSDPSHPFDDGDYLLGTIISWGDAIRGHKVVEARNYESPYDIFEQEIPAGSYVRPVFAYVHGGVALSTETFSCPFDSGQVGWIYIPREKAVEAFGEDHKPQQVYDCAIAELKQYEDYINGNVWGFVLEEGEACSCCKHVHYEETDSCWGFYGDDAKDGIAEHIPDEAKTLLDEAWENREY